MIPKFRMWNRITSQLHLVGGLYFDDKEAEYVDDDNVLRFIDFKNIELMQSIGLKDKNGKEIFEGDIVKCSGLLGTIESFKAMWICSFVKYNNYQKVGFFAQEIEVVGNIYENPELLEDKE